MKTSTLLRATTMIALAAAAALSFGQQFTEYYSLHHDDMSGPLDSFTTTVGTNTWSASAPNWFTVTGDAYDTPMPWRILFKHLTNPSTDHWTTTQGFQYSFSSSVKVTNVEYYYNEDGYDFFTPGVGSSSAVRYLNDHINKSVTWVIGDYETQSGNPPGGP